MIIIDKVYSGSFSATETFILAKGDDVIDTVQTVVEIHPIAAGSATLAKSSAPIPTIQAGAANVAWYDFPSMPASAAYENIVTGAAAIRLTVTSGTWAINIRRGLT